MVCLLQLAYLQRDAHDGGTRHQPLLCLEILATAIAKLKLRSPCQADLLAVLERYMGCCATNERIARTPIPPPYSRCVLCVARAASSPIPGCAGIRKHVRTDTIVLAVKALPSAVPL